MPSREDKFENALEAINQLLFLFDRCGERSWQKHFQDLRQALIDHDSQTTLYLWQQTPMGSMGGLLDLGLCPQNGHSVRDLDADNRLLEKLIGCVSQTLTNLRVFFEYNIDKPLVEIPSGK